VDNHQTGYQARTYRQGFRKSDLVAFRVVIKETDLSIQADLNLESTARELVIENRGIIESYIRQFPEFATTLSPWRCKAPVPHIIGDMIHAGRVAQVGPMAAVAGAMAYRVGIELMAHSSQAIVENGGDLFIHTSEPVTVAVYAGQSPLNLQIGLRVGGQNIPTSVCTSSGTIGHSLSFGNADAVVVTSRSCAVADASATAIGNRIQGRSDIETAIEWGKRIDGIEGILIIFEDKMGVWGPLELVRLSRKKG